MGEWWLIAGAIAAALTALFTGYAVLQRAMERPRPRWRFTRSTTAGRTSQTEQLWIFVTAQNIGDGPAFNASLTPKNSAQVDAAASRTRAAAVETGDSLVLAVFIPKHLPRDEDAYGNLLIAPTATPEDIGNLIVRVTWNHPPHRWWTRRRHYRVRHAPTE